MWLAFMPITDKQNSIRSNIRVPAFWHLSSRSIRCTFKFIFLLSCNALKWFFSYRAEQCPFERPEDYIMSRYTDIGTCHNKGSTVTNRRTVTGPGMAYRLNLNRCRYPIFLLLLIWDSIPYQYPIFEKILIFADVRYIGKLICHLYWTHRGYEFAQSRGHNKMVCKFYSCLRKIRRHVFAQ